MFKKIFSIVIISILFLNNLAFADTSDDEYIVTLSPDTPALLSADNGILKSVVNELGIYKCSADELDIVKNMYGVVSIEPNAEKNYTHKDGQPVDPNDVLDTVGHGTAVATIAAAQSNNLIGLAGVSQAEIVSLRIYSDRAPLNWVIEAIFDAVDIYACDVINLSLGVSEPSPSLKAAVDYAIEKGVIVVAAAGNYIDNESGIKHTYPASYDNVVSVASVDSNGNHASHSYTNDKVNIAAPGEDVIIRALNDGRYYEGAGTSYACPHVSAAAAIMKGIKPSITSSEFMKLIKETSVDTEDNGYDIKTGYGILSIAKIMEILLKEQNAVELSRVKVNSREINFKCKNFSDSKTFSGTHILGVYNGDILENASITPFQLGTGEEKLFSYNGITNSQKYKSIFIDNLNTVKPISF